MFLMLNDMFEDDFARNNNLDHFMLYLSRASDTTYAKQNGGKYNFIIKGKTAVPDDQVCII